MLQRRRAQDPQPVQDLATAQYRVQDLLQLGSDWCQPLQYVAIWCNTMQYRIIMDTIIYNYIYTVYIYMHDANYMIIYDYDWLCWGKLLVRKEFLQTLLSTTVFQRSSLTGCSGFLCTWTGSNCPILLWLCHQCFRAEGGSSPKQKRNRWNR